MRIFVTVGTGKFDLLIKEVDTIALKFNPTIIAQIGKGKFIPKNITYFRFKESLMDEYQKADLIIAHAGAGTTYEVLGLGKKIIIVPNLNRTDSHQLDIVKKLSEEGYLIGCKKINDLSKILKDIKNTKFKKYFLPKNNIISIIKKYIDK